MISAQRFDQLVEDEGDTVRWGRCSLGRESESGLQLAALDQFNPVQRKKYVQHRVPLCWLRASPQYVFCWLSRRLVCHRREQWECCHRPRASSVRWRTEGVPEVAW